ncbi:dynein regulatory complex subunit 2-like [Teleopsis dalmanni]|uniref:dynein regulatory complex subunit 2-like n=1 Tax=Teleopsis dalmanni TaxID=139649 RepID=UPI0018CF3E11|nr:dynein regulatory complex subunit 2-like [Teleopsis dalmanni]
MGKKGKANKLAKMSEEERARYLQLRADIEEEARRRKMQLLSLFMKNKLKREDAFCRLNLAKINQEWRSLLRQIKCDELRNEIMEVEKFFEEALERKNQTINRLFDELDLAEDMYGTMQQSHMETINSFIGRQQERTDFFRNQYMHQQTTVLDQYKEDVVQFKKSGDRSFQQLESIFYQLKSHTDKEKEESQEEQQKRVDDVKSTITLRLENITKVGELKLENLWQEYQDVLSAYMRRNEGFYAEYVDLKERDEESTTLIRTQCYEMEKATEHLSRLKLKYSDLTDKNDVKMKYLTKLRSDLCERLANLKQTANKEIEDGNKKFKLMSVTSHIALKHIEKIAAQGERLMQMAAICRNYEKENEILAPFGLPPISREMFVNTEEELAQAPDMLKDCNILQKKLGRWHLMEKFWRRVNNVIIDNAYLKKEKKQLEDENAQLKAKLQEHLVNLNLSSGSNAHIDEYLLKRPSSMRVDRVVQIDLERKPKSQSADVNHERYRRPLTSCLEANFTNAVRSKQLLRGRVKQPKIVSIINW